MTISPNIATGLILVGLLFNFTGLITLGALFFGVVVVFMVLTLPVEFDASMRGLRMLKETGLFQTEQDRSGARMVLIAAAMTYVAAAVQAILQLIYYLSLARR
jgi:Zn-dependent membrane protease YugP